MKITETWSDIGTRPVTLELTEEEVLALWVLCGSGVCGNPNNPIRVLTDSIYEDFSERFGDSSENANYGQMVKTFKGAVEAL